MFYLIFLIIGGFLIGLSYPLGIEPLYFDIYVTIFGCLGLSVGYVGLGFLFVRGYIKKISSNTVGKNMPHGFAKRMLLYRVLLLVIYAIQIYILHFPLVVRLLGLENVMFLGVFLVLLPFFATYLISILPFHKLDCILRESKWNMWEYFIFQVRSFFLIAVMPLLIFVFYIDFIYHVDVLYELIYIYPLSGWLMTLSLMFVLFIFAPLVLRFAWNLKSLSRGSLRKKLEKIRDKSEVKIKDILIWPIGRGRMANAMVIGLIRKWRYIIITDTLINSLTEEETETVFAHEIGHAKQYHILFYFVFAAGYMCLAVVLEEFLSNIMGRNNPMIATYLFGLVVIYWGVFFGKVSRRLEHQADLYGALITNNFEGFSNALRKISSVNASPSSQKSVQHPSIEKRVRFLEATENSPEFINRFLLSIKKVIGVLMVVLVFGIVGCAWVSYKQFQEAPSLKLNLVKQRMVYEKAMRGYELLEERKYTQAVKVFEEVVLFLPPNALYYIWLGDALQGDLDRLPKKSIEAYKEARLLNPADPAQRMYLHEKLKGVK